MDDTIVYHCEFFNKNREDYHDKCNTFLRTHKTLAVLRSEFSGVSEVDKTKLLDDCIDDPDKLDEFREGSTDFDLPLLQKCVKVANIQTFRNFCSIVKFNKLKLNWGHIPASERTKDRIEFILRRSGVEDERPFQIYIENCGKSTTFQVSTNNGNDWTTITPERHQNARMSRRRTDVIIKQADIELPCELKLTNKMWYRRVEMYVRRPIPINWLGEFSVSDTSDDDSSDDEEEEEEETADAAAADAAAAAAAAKIQARWRRWRGKIAQDVYIFQIANDTKVTIKRHEIRYHVRNIIKAFGFLDVDKKLIWVPNIPTKRRLMNILTWDKTKCPLMKLCRMLEDARYLKLSKIVCERIYSYINEDLRGVRKYDDVISALSGNSFSHIHGAGEPVVEFTIRY